MKYGDAYTGNYSEACCYICMAHVDLKVSSLIVVYCEAMLYSVNDIYIFQHLGCLNVF